MIKKGDNIKYVMFLKYFFLTFLLFQLLKGLRGEGEKGENREMGGLQSIIKNCLKVEGVKRFSDGKILAVRKSNSIIFAGICRERSFWVIPVISKAFLSFIGPHSQHSSKTATTRIRTRVSLVTGQCANHCAIR